MIVDLLLALSLGLYLQSLFVFLLLFVLAGVFVRPDRPWSSGLLRAVLLAAGLSMLLGRCDGDAP